MVPVDVMLLLQTQFLYLFVPSSSLHQLLPAFSSSASVTPHRHEKKYHSPHCSCCNHKFFSSSLSILFSFFLSSHILSSLSQCSSTLLSFSSSLTDDGKSSQHLYLLRKQILQDGGPCSQSGPIVKGGFLQIPTVSSSNNWKTLALQTFEDDYGEPYLNSSSEEEERGRARVKDPAYRLPDSPYSYNYT